MNKNDLAHKITDRPSELRAGLSRWFAYYNHHRPHSRLAGKTPAEAYGQIDASDHGGHAPHDLITRMAA